MGTTGVRVDDTISDEPVRDQETEVRSLADKPAAARENNRCADRRIADLEARIAEPQLGQGNKVSQHSGNGKP